MIPKIAHLKCLGFGDQLFRPLFTALSEGEIEFIWSSDKLRKTMPSLLTCGSIMHLANTNDFIYGTGTLFDDRNPIVARNLNVYAVRGPLCRSLLINKGINCPEIYIDPGVLFGVYFGSKNEIGASTTIGVLPHFVDYDRVSKVKLPLNYMLINPLDDPMIVLAKIQMCSKIISSSLHGVIVAEALNIPAAWVEFSDNVIGKGMKFYDYFYGSGRCFADIARNDMRGEINLSNVRFNPPADFMFEQAVNAAPDWLIHPVQKQFLIEKYNFINNKRKIVSGINSQFMNWTPVSRSNEITVDRNRLASDTVFLKMLNSVKNKRAFSIIRIGDGEFACMNEFLRKPGVKLNSSWISDVGGKIELSDISSGKLGKDLILAIDGSTIVGMSSWANHHKSWTPPDEIREKLKNKLTCNTWFSMEWRANGCMDTLLSECSFAVLHRNAKTCLKLIERNRCLDSRFRNPMKEHGAFVLDGNYDEAEEFIKNTSYDVYLVSCGPKGKLWLTEMANKYSKVMLDVGHSMERTWVKY